MFEQFPRPPRDTHLGLHYFPDSHHFGTEALRRWLPELVRLPLSWLTLRATMRVPVPAAFLNELRQAGIEPVVIIEHQPGVEWEQRTIEEQAQHYARAGARYVALLHEPNRERSWSVGEWQRPHLVSRVMRLLLPALETFAGAGLFPLLPALYPGGDYWDTAFLASMLDQVAERGSATLLERLGLAIQPLAFNRPLGWGEGGQAQWPDARPFASLLQDHRGWRLWEWYEQITRARLGRALPMIAVAGGAPLGSQEQADLPALSVERHTERNLDIARLMRGAGRPESLFNVNFWLLAADERDPAHAQAWFRADGSTLPIVERLRAEPAASAAPVARALPRAAPAPISHYLLLPSWEWGISSLHWEAVCPFVQAVRPTVGFQLEEALRAERVTLLVGAHGWGEEAATQLREAGCTVESVPAPDHATIREGFRQRALAARAGR